MVKIEHIGSSLEISAGFHPNFIQPKDKLSVHKVISISFQVHIPKNMAICIIGTSTNVFANGEYANLQVLLEDGSYNLDAIHGTTKVLTRSGDIHVRTKGATFMTKNSYGSIEKETIPEADDFF